MKELLTWNKKHFTSFLKVMFQLSKVASDLRVRLSYTTVTERQLWSRMFFSPIKYNKSMLRLNKSILNPWRFIVDHIYSLLSMSISVCWKVKKSCRKSEVDLNSIAETWDIFCKRDKSMGLGKECLTSPILIQIIKNYSIQGSITFSSNWQMQQGSGMFHKSPYKVLRGLL